MERGHRRLVGIFAYQDDLLKAIQIMKEHKIHIATAISPARNEAVDAAVGVKPSPVRWITLGGGILGALTGFGLSVYTVLQWKFVVQGKPVVPITPFVIETFEFCILFGGLSAFLGILLTSRLPRLRLPRYYDPLFSVDHFGLVVVLPEEEHDRAVEILQEAGAKDVRDVE